MHSYDAADRLVDPGISYDDNGRTTTLPASLLPAGSSSGIASWEPGAGTAVTTATGTPGPVTIDYYADDMVRDEKTASGGVRTWQVDPDGRLRCWTDSSTDPNTCTHTNHYDSSSDSPAWTSETSDGSSWTRNITDLTGDLIATADQSGTLTLQLSNLHGDIVATANTSGSLLATFETDEFGNPRADSNGNQNSSQRYQWLGTTQRSDDTIAGLALMGVRLYNPALGRFLQVDPVPGGSANDYDYSGQDPVNNFDLDGRMFASGDGDHPNYCSPCGHGNVGVSAGSAWVYAATAIAFAPEEAGAGAAAAGLAGALAITAGAYYAGKGLGHLIMHARRKSGHAKDRSGERGISDDMIEQTIRTGKPRRGNQKGTTKYVGRKLWVVVNTKTGRIVSVGRN